MKKELLVLLLLISVAICAFEPGLSDQDIHFIHDYRLPAWGYKGFGFNISGSGYNKGYEAGDFYRHEQYSVYLDPSFDMRNESENDITKLEFNLNASYNYFRNPGYYRGSDISRSVNLQPSFSMAKKKYKDSTKYTHFEALVNYNYVFRNDDYNNSWYSNSEVNDRTLDTAFLAGFGSGMVRDVTPVIRALRFKQRYNSLGKGSLTDQEISKLAEVMAMYPGYSYVYDRSGKEFWNSAFNSLGNKAVGLNGYETFFITEAMQEEVGKRLEGSEFNLNLQYSRTDFNANGNYYDLVLAYFGPVLQAKLYSNVSIGHQVGMELIAGIYFPSSDIKPFDSMNLSKLSHSQLITITDRLLYNFNGVFTVQKTTYAYDTNSGIAFEIFNDFSFYIENNLSLSLSLDYLYQKFEHGTFTDDDYYNYNQNYYNGLYTEFGEWDFGLSLNYRFRSM